MKKLIFCLCLFISGLRVMAQNDVSGRVTDADRQALPGATIYLIHLPDSAQLNGRATDNNGGYMFPRVAAGRYLVKASMMGFKTSYSYPFSLTGKPILLPQLVLSDQSTSLKAVTISSSIPQLVQKNDRLVVNVERLNTTGDNALDVLKKAPGIRLDKDDNILFRGNGGVTIMIDGRQTYMTGTELSNYLKSLPGNTISKVELIANPPGNYDAEGTAGIVNIILKHSELEGLNGTVNANAGYGKYGKLSGGLNLNYNSGKVGLYTRINSAFSDSYNKLTLSRLIGNQLYDQYNYWHPNSYANSYVIGADFYPGKTQTVGIMFKGYNDPVNANVTSQSASFDNSGTELNSVTGLSKERSNVGTYNLDLNYSAALDTAGERLEFDADYIYSSAAANQSYINTYYNGQGVITNVPVQLRGSAPVDYNIKALKADYVLPLADHWQAEAGLKSSWVSTQSNVKFDSLQTTGWVNDPKHSDNFHYNENINAAYLTLSKTFSKHWDFKAGVRAEQTVSSASSATNDLVNRNYCQLFPSVFLNYKINDDNHINASFSSRINRPNYGTLNSAIRYTDPYTAIQGNPFLQPSISQSYVLSYTYKSFQVLSLSYLKVNNSVSTELFQNDTTKQTLSKYENIGTTSTLSATSAGSFNILKWWNVSVEADAAYDRVATVVQGTAFNQSAFSWSGNIDQNFSLPHNLKLLVDAQYFSPSIAGLERTLAGSQIDAGLTKSLMDKKLSISFKARDIFFGNRYRSLINYNNVNTRWTNEYESRRFTLGVTYKFGNSKMKAARDRDTGSSSEEKRM